MCKKMVSGKRIKHTSMTVLVNAGMSESIKPKSLANLFNIRPKKRQHD